MSEIYNSNMSMFEDEQPKELLDSGSSSTILMGDMTSRLKQKQPETTAWETKPWKFTKYKKVNLDFCLPEFRAEKLYRGSVTWIITLKVGTSW